MKPYEQEKQETLVQVARLADTILENNQDSTKLLFHLLMKRQHDGLNGRQWDASIHLANELRIQQILAGYPTLP